MFKSLSVTCALIANESRLRLKCDGMRRNQISSFGETYESF